jgi:hypothetical protein
MLDHHKDFHGDTNHFDDHPNDKATHPLEQ